jgi:hypothetical protein
MEQATEKLLKDTKAFMDAVNGMSLQGLDIELLVS